MISLSWADIFLSISPCHSLIVRSTSPAMTLPGLAASAWRTTSSMNCLLRCRSLESAGLVWSRIWSSKLASPASTVVAPPAVACCDSAMLLSLLRLRFPGLTGLDPHLLGQRLHLFAVRQHVLEQPF